MININDINFGYKRKQTVFNGLTLNLEAGGIYGLLGRNGTGKSTLLYLISGLLRPSRGSVTIDGVDSAKRTIGTLQDLYLVAEEYNTPNVSMKRYVNTYAPFYPKFSEETLLNCLDGFDMSFDISLGELSMGQKKKALMCFALATNTKYLLMDEPSNGLDIPSKSQFRRVVAQSMTDERTIIISTHQVRDIDTLIDNVTVIDNSELLLNESVERISKRLYFGECALGETAEDSLFVQPSVHGNYFVRRNTNNEDSALNLEILFNALLSKENLLHVSHEGKL
ncbi:MAG: ATP-binding cassette domain-containing protein [Bacteroidaceae bacterium]